MEKWRVDFHKKNGKIVKGIMESPCSSSNEVFKYLFSNGNVADYIGISSIDGKTDIFIRTCEISSVHISAVK